MVVKWLRKLALATMQMKSTVVGYQVYSLLKYAEL